jgi:hypothetical protein
MAGAAFVIVVTIGQAWAAAAGSFIGPFNNIQTVACRPWWAGC